MMTDEIEDAAMHAARVDELRAELARRAEMIEGLTKARDRLAEALLAAQAGERVDTGVAPVSVGDAVQVAPEKCELGPVLMIVDRVRLNAIRGYFYLIGKGVEYGEHAHMWVQHGDYRRIGPAGWVLRIDDEGQEQ